MGDACVPQVFLPEPGGMFLSEGSVPGSSRKYNLSRRQGICSFCGTCGQWENIESFFAGLCSGWPVRAFRNHNLEPGAFTRFPCLPQGHAGDGKDLPAKE